MSHQCQIRAYVQPRLWEDSRFDYMDRAPPLRHIQPQDVAVVGGSGLVQSRSAAAGAQHPIGAATIESQEPQAPEINC